MSLKAKIEAVIYASEEPVTLPQLIGLLGLEAQAELEELESRQASLALEAASAPEPEPAESGTGPAFPEDRNADVLPGPPDVPTEAGFVTEAEANAEAVARAGPQAVPMTPAAWKARERALREYFRSLLDGLIADYANGDRGLEIREVAGGFRLATKPEYHDAVRGFVKSLKPPLKLSLQALETLAVVAYKQPVTAPEVSEIRGVDSGGVLAGLMTRKLVTTAGRKQVIGRPILYKTTKDFLMRFGLKDIAELPSIEEFERMAGELADADPVQEEMPMPTEPSGTDISGNAAAGQLPGDYQSNAPYGTRQFHQSTEGVMSDHGDGTDGRKTEPPTAAELEPSANIHEAQADGVPGDEADSSFPDDPTNDFDANKGGA